MSEDGSSPWLFGREGAGPEETMKEACEASQGTGLDLITSCLGRNNNNKKNDCCRP